MTKTNFAKKILLSLLACVFAISACFVMTACGEDSTGKVMNLSLNPQIELILDENDKVVSVTALNVEGSYIVANVTFTGLTAEQAVKTFLEATKENGFMVQGQVTLADNTLDIQISGDDAQKLFNSVKDYVTPYLADMNVSVKFELDDIISKADLQEMVAECMQELDINEIKKYSEEKLMQLIQESRKATEDIYAVELREFYYEARANEILEAKYKAIVDALNIPALTSLYTNLTTAIGNLESSYINHIAGTDYQSQLENYINCKKQELRSRLETLDAGVVAEINQNLAEAEEAFYGATGEYQKLESAISGFVSGLQTAIGELQSYLDILGDLLVSDSTINNAIATAKANFDSATSDTGFAKLYEECINNDYWNGLAQTNA